MALYGHHESGNEDHNSPMTEETHAEVVRLLKKATSECLNNMQDDNIPMIDAIELLTKAYLEMAVVNALAHSTMLGLMPSVDEFKAICGEVFTTLKARIIQ